MSVGESQLLQDVKLMPSDPTLLIEIPFVALEENNIPVAGMSLGTSLQMSGGITAQVVEIDGDNGVVKLDANHPLSRVKGTNMALSLAAVAEPVLDANGDWSTWSDPKYETATFAGGCFWGLELLFQRMPGVAATKVGYTQGEKLDPTYQEVCSGSTGHTEGVQVAFDKTVVSFETLVERFFDRLGADATKPNQVGNDRGTQYRHGVYPHTPEQMVVAKAALAKIEGAVTEVETAVKFYDGEEYHQQYLQKGGQSAVKEDTTLIRCYG